jgi:hypothetical protein
MQRHGNNNVYVLMPPGLAQICTIDVTQKGSEVWRMMVLQRVQQLLYPAPAHKKQKRSGKGEWQPSGQPQIHRVFAVQVVSRPGQLQQT